MLLNKALSQMSKWFSANKLSLNLDKTSVIKFKTKNWWQFPLNVQYNDKYIEEAVITKFHGLQIDNYLNRKQLRGACYAVRYVLHTSNINTLKSIYFAYFHSSMKYEIIFWGNSADSKKVCML
jgi:hypothetical protein